MKNKILSLSLIIIVSFLLFACGKPNNLDEITAANNNKTGIELNENQNSQIGGDVNDTSEIEDKEKNEENLNDEKNDTINETLIPESDEELNEIINQNNEEIIEEEFFTKIPEIFITYYNIDYSDIKNVEYSFSNIELEDLNGNRYKASMDGNNTFECFIDYVNSNGGLEFLKEFGCTFTFDKQTVLVNKFFKDENNTLKLYLDDNKNTIKKYTKDQYKSIDSENDFRNYYVSFNAKSLMKQVSDQCLVME